MNKYTLKFIDRNLERIFQKRKIDTFQFHIFLILNVAGISILIINVINNIKDDKNKVLNYLKIGIVIFLFLSTIFITYRRQYSNEFLMITNILTIIIEFNLRNDFDVYDGYLFGANQTIMHLIILIVQSFTIAMFTNVILCGSRIVITHIQSIDGLNITQLIYSILITILLGIILYHVERLQRQIFMLSVKDNSMDTVIPSLIKKPYCIFILDADSMKFKKIQMNFNELNSQLLNQDDPLKDFLTIALHNKITLREHIYKQIQRLNQRKIKHFQESLKIKYQNLKIRITFQAFHLETVFYTLTIDQEEYNLQQLKQQLNIQQIKMKSIFGTLLKSSINLFNQYRNKQYINSQKMIKLTLYQIYAFMQNKDKIKIETINLRKLVFRLLRIIHRSKCNIQFICTQQILLLSVRRILILVIIELFKNLDRERRIKIQLKFEADRACLIIGGMTGLPDSRLFQECSNILFEKIHISLEGFVLIFNPEPILTFNQVQKLI